MVKVVRFFHAADGYSVVCIPWIRAPSAKRNWHHGIVRK